MRNDEEDMAHETMMLFARHSHERCQQCGHLEPEQNCARGQCCVLRAVQMCSVLHSSVAHVDIAISRWRYLHKNIFTTSASHATRATEWTTTRPDMHCPRLHQVSLDQYRCSANLRCEALAVIAIVAFAAAAAAAAQREVCVRATSLRWTQLRFFASRNLEIASE